VGGTSTDAAVLSPSNQVLGAAKVPTTADVLGGVEAALRLALRDAGVDPGQSLILH
jgi:N-methylhydantoinase A/oxoprolinase/acetone carboxylase beta subunit